MNVFEQSTVSLQSDCTLMKLMVLSLQSFRNFSVALSGQQTLVELHASRTNEDVRMYIEEYLF